MDQKRINQMKLLFVFLSRVKHAPKSLAISLIPNDQQVPRMSVWLWEFWVGLQARLPTSHGPGDQNCAKLVQCSHTFTPTVMGL